MIVTCSFCGTKGRVPWGRKCRCPQCKRDYTITAMTGAVNEPPPQRSAPAVGTQGEVGGDDLLDMLAGEDPGWDDLLRTLRKCDSADMWTSNVNRMQDTPLRRFARSCWPKVMHETREHALNHVDALVSRGVHKDGSLHVYECPTCHAWHVGHSRGV